MPERKPFAIINDILNCINHITLYTGNLSFDELKAASRKNYFVIRLAKTTANHKEHEKIRPGNLTISGLP